MASLEKLEELLSVKSLVGPDTDGKVFIRLSCQVDFEPHGRASETWEVEWVLTLPQIPHHWRSTAGWRKGTTDAPIRFQGRTATNVIARAISFLEEAAAEELVLGYPDSVDKGWKETEDYHRDDILGVN